MHNDLFITPQDSDPGSEGALGYDYQRDVAVLQCIKMLVDKQVEYVICEFHEDLVTSNKQKQLSLIQVKKAERDSWTLDSLLTPPKKQPKGILAKLFTHMEAGKSISVLSLQGFGRVGGASRNGNCSLGGLIQLTKVPRDIRATEWHAQVAPYVEYIAPILAKQGIDRTTVIEALNLLEIDFGLPHPNAIGDHCCKTLGKCLKETWQLDLTWDELEKIYQAIYLRVKAVSIKPRQPWTTKAISRQEILEIARVHLHQFVPSLNRTSIMTIQDKLTSVGMGNRTTYGLQRRIDAMILKHELGIDSFTWTNYRAALDVEITCIHENNSMLRGPQLWQSLLTAFQDLGNTWSSQTDARLNATFVEGVFFDMTGLCEVQWMRSR